MTCVDLQLLEQYAPIAMLPLQPPLLIPWQCSDSGSLSHWSQAWNLERYEGEGIQIEAEQVKPCKNRKSMILLLVLVLVEFLGVIYIEKNENMMQDDLRDLRLSYATCPKQNQVGLVPTTTQDLCKIN
ncbi:hypothetical protein Droror1_Dr00009710 [Drosera rotundifolia]